MRAEYTAPRGRQLIRKRWQITVPRAIREHLNLYIGQLLSWDLAEDEMGNPEIRIYAGNFRTPNDLAAYQTASAKRKKEERKWRKKIRKSDIKKARKIIQEHGG